jgi:N-acetyl sugar amidotransferase
MIEQKLKKNIATKNALSEEGVTCSNCILSINDTKNISFDERGVCNYCNNYFALMKNIGSKEKRTKWLNEKVEEIKIAGKNKKYDCVIGISGGLDSCYLALWAKENGLRPLLVHFDNGWNSELALTNIQSICYKLEFDLQTIVINWNEFKQLQLAYLRAGVIDIEVLTDHAISSTIEKLARKNRIKYNISGFNYSTEAIMPRGWAFDKTDFVNINDINKKFGSVQIKTYPHLIIAKRLWYSFFQKTETVMVLNYLNRNQQEIKKELTEKLGWREYGGKHYESVFTKFYQAYILPKKFGVDKRKAHLSNLICSEQITKKQAYQKLNEPLYNMEELKIEKAYVLKKLDLSENDFDKIMSEKPRKHKEFKTQKKFWKVYFAILKLLRPWKKIAI